MERTHSARAHSSPPPASRLLAFPLALTLTLTFILTTLPASHAHSQVVINEILYHAPDDLDLLQFIELHNTSTQPQDLSGWRFTKGIQFEFPPSTTLPPSGFLVICRNQKFFSDYFPCPVAGEFKKNLKRSGERIELQDAQGRLIDQVEFKDAPPWPVSPDGLSASLERICPTADSQSPHNWAPSSLPPSRDRPGGSPGQINDSFQATLPPPVLQVTWSPTHPQPLQPVQVQIQLAPQSPTSSVHVQYQTCLHRQSSSTNSIQAAPHPQKPGTYTATLPGAPTNTLVRFRIVATNPTQATRFHPHPHDVRPMFSLFVHPEYPRTRIPQLHLIQTDSSANLLGEPDSGFRRFLRSGGAPDATGPLHGPFALVWIPTNQSPPLLRDFIDAHPRNAGYKIHLHKDQPIEGMTSLNLLYEAMDRFVLAEPMAFALYQQAGNPACNTSFARLSIDEKPLGFHLLVEQPNKSFLRRNRIHDGGHLYKLIWQGRGVVGQHEKKTRTHEGHQDVIRLVRSLNEKNPEKLAATLRSELDVTNVATYFAVNMVLSHWDGFFNNYFLYHDTGKTGQWMMFPWDQDKTWGFHDGLRSGGLFTDMPTTFGMKGDKPPGWTRAEPPANFFEAGTMWWRPGGWISSPALAEPSFRKIYLQRIRDILEYQYTPELWEPQLQALENLLSEEVQFRATLFQNDPQVARQRLTRQINLLRRHVKERRTFLLAQPEIRDLKPTPRAEK